MIYAHTQVRQYQRKYYYNNDDGDHRHENINFTDKYYNYLLTVNKVPLYFTDMNWRKIINLRVLEVK